MQNSLSQDIHMRPPGIQATFRKIRLFSTRRKCLVVNAGDTINILHLQVSQCRGQRHGIAEISP